MLKILKRMYACQNWKCIHTFFREKYLTLESKLDFRISPSQILISFLISIKFFTFWEFLFYVQCYPEDLINDHHFQWRLKFSKWKQCATETISWSLVFKFYLQTDTKIIPSALRWWHPKLYQVWNYHGVGGDGYRMETKALKLKMKEQWQVIMHIGEGAQSTFCSSL